MAWTENKKFKIKLTSPSGQFAAVCFEVAEASRKEFHKELRYFLAACQTNLGAFRKCDTAVDAETGEKVFVEIHISGERNRMIETLNAHIGTLRSHCVSVV